MGQITNSDLPDITKCLNLLNQHHLSYLNEDRMWLDDRLRKQVSWTSTNCRPDQMMPRFLKWDFALELSIKMMIKICSNGNAACMNGGMHPC